MKKKQSGARLEPAKPKKENIPQGLETGADQPGKKKGLSKPLKITLIVLAAVALVFLILFFVYKSWARLPDVPDLPVIDAGEPTPDPVTGIVPSREPVGPRKDGFYTFLVVGRDTGGGGNTDTIMLAAYDLTEQKLSVISIPRDTMVNVRHPDRNHKINGVWNLGLYYAGKDSKKEGIEYLKEAVGDMVGFVPDFHVIINWEAFGRLVKAIGGVEFDVPFDMVYKDPTQNLEINVPKGKRVLTPEEAMGVVRWRHNNSYSQQYADGDLGRIRTQQALLKEIIKKCLKIENVTKITEFAQIFTEEVETDLTMGNLVAFAERAIFGGLTMDNVAFSTIPVDGVYVKGDSYVQVRPEELLGIINADFNPYREDLEMDKLQILQYNADRGYYLYQGSGTGTPPPEPTVKPSAQPTPKPTSTPAPAGTPKPTAQAPSATQTPTPADPEPTPEPTPEPPPANPEPTPEPLPEPTPDTPELGIPTD